MDYNAGIARLLLGSLLFTFLILSVQGSTGGAILWIQWSYSNPDSLLDDGRLCDRFSNRHCDVYFSLCLRNAASPSTGRDKCSIYQHQTATYDNAVSLEFSGSKGLQVPIPAPVPNFYTLEMDIYDADFVPNYELVGSFVAENLEITPKDEFQIIQMKNKNRQTSNKRLTITLQMKLVCKESYFGKHCATECVPNSEKYECNEDGQRICKQGFTGKDCEMEDSCFYEPCAPHATCQNREDGLGRYCICNGQEGPQCYPNYDPCSPSPCKNDGVCHSAGHYGESFRCECTEGWTGHRCTERRLACVEAAEELKQQHSTWAANDSLPNDQIEVCLNGGKCLEYPDRFAYRCVCSDGWDGQRCELPVTDVQAPAKLMYILVILIGVFLSILVVALTIGLIWRSRRSKMAGSAYIPRHGGIVYYHSDRDSTGTVASFLQSHPHLSNELYGSPALTDKIYISSPNAYKSNAARRFRNDVYDECDPLGLDTKSGVYGQAFENEALVTQDNPRNSTQTRGDDSAPPLPERPMELNQISSRQPSILSMPTGEGAVPTTWDTFKNETRKPTVYRPLSPSFTPTTIERDKNRSSIPI